MNSTAVPKENLPGRLLAIAVIVGGLAGLFVYAGGWLTPHELTPARFVDRFEQLGGVHPGFRRNHAKGVCVSGYFESNGRGTEVSKASVFLSGKVPVVGRFSFGGGNPYAADGPTAVRGFGLRFELPHREEWRTAMVNLAVFPAQTPQAFYEFILATAPDPKTGKPDPAKIKAFLDAHPESGKALQVIGSQTKFVPFENSPFNSLNTFGFVNAAGAVSWVRWSLEPVAPVAAVKNEASPPQGTNYLFDDLIAAIHRGPVQWHLILTVAQAGDPTDNATIPWPDSRTHIDAGTLTIDKVESDDVAVARDLNFDPLTLPDGMQASDDPLLSARSAVYSQDFTRREGEPKEPSAISEQEAEK